MKIASIGLGIMGCPMAGHLLQAGHELVVFNIAAIPNELSVAEQRAPPARMRRRAAPRSSSWCPTHLMSRLPCLAATVSPPAFRLG